MVSSERKVIKMKEEMQQTRKSRSGLNEPCVHVAGKDVRIPKICMRNHECWHCAFDQWIEVMEEAVNYGYGLMGDREVLPRAA